MEKRNPELKTSRLPNGQSYAELVGYGGEEGYYTVFDTALTLLQPERSSTSVDSLCVSGAFTKDGLTVRMSSESAYDYCCLLYDPAQMSAAQIDQVKAWTNDIIAALHEKKAPVEYEDDEW